MGLARNLDADWRYFSAKKIVGGLFFTDMFEIPSVPRVSPPIHYHLTQDEWFCPGRRARIPDWLGALTMFKPAGVFLVPEWVKKTADLSTSLRSGPTARRGRRDDNFV
jgi:hypothetical protein